VGELEEKFAQEKQHLSKKYRQQIKHAFAPLEPVVDVLLTDLKPDQIDQALSKLAPSYRNLQLRVLKVAFNFAVKMRWIEENPANQLEATRTPKHDEVTVLRVEEAQNLLDTCMKLDAELLPYNLFGLFAGIRPQDELTQMRWEHVRLDEAHILLPASITKTGKRRVVDIEPNLSVWLDALPNWGIERGEMIAPKNLRKRLRKVRAEAGLVPWKQDVMRHSYASYHLAKNENIERLLQNLGHRSPDMLWEHYHKAVLKKDAERYWGIFPPC